MAMRVLGVNDILEEHIGLDLECFDRIYLNGWVPNPQVPGQVVSFLTGHLRFLTPSPAILERIGLRFRNPTIVIWWMRPSGRRSSKSAHIFRIRSRSDSMATSTPNALLRQPGSATPSWITGSLPPMIPPACGTSATVSGRG